MTDSKPQVGVSACLLGEKVRYDGGHRAQQVLLNQLAKRLALHAFCPEVAGGLGIPRAPANLVERDGIIAVLGAEDNTLDVTSAFYCGTNAIVSQCPTTLCAYIVKARSPSCGAGTTPIYSENGETLRNDDGLLVQALRRARPNLWIVDESYFESSGAAERFISRCIEIHRQHST